MREASKILERGLVSFPALTHPAEAEAAAMPATRRGLSAKRRFSSRGKRWQQQKALPSGTTGAVARRRRRRRRLHQPPASGGGCYRSRRRTAPRSGGIRREPSCRLRQRRPPPRPSIPLLASPPLTARGCHTFTAAVGAAAVQEFSAARGVAAAPGR